MPAMANMTLKAYNGSTDVVYSVLVGSGPLYSWADTLQGTPGGYRTISLQVKQPSDPTKGVTRVIEKIARPFVNTTTGLVDYIGRVSIEVLVPVNATLAERQELYAMAKNSLAHANLLSAIVDGQGMY